MQHYNECIEVGLDKRTASQFAAFQDIAQMLKDERAKPIEQRKQEWMERLVVDFKRFHELGVELPIGFSKRFCDHQFVRAKLQNGKVFIIAGDMTWQPPDISIEEKYIPQFKKGKKIKEFENVQALTNFLWE